MRGSVLTGSPGVGKTTAFLKAIELLRSYGISVGGFVSKEVRERGVRVGFEVMDLRSGRRGWLARVGVSSGPRIGKYTVSIEDFERVGVSALNHALDSLEVELVALDEVGPMEMCSVRFRSLVKDVFSGVKPFILTLHRRLVSDPTVPRNVDLIEVTLANRTGLADKLAVEAYKMVRGESPSSRT